MQVTFTARHMEVSDSLRQHTLEKMDKLQKYMDLIVDADVTMSVEKYRHKIEVKIKGQSGHVTGTEVSNDMYQSIDRVFDKLEKQLRRRKDRRINLHRSKSRDEFQDINPAIARDIEPEGVDASTIVWEEVIDEIVESEILDTKPMSAEEALLQFKLLESDFYVFKDAHSDNAINVIYRRHDGKIGLIRTT
ncbi:ribosome-associated translation inhibitor RaiA [bacterium]|nr:ribosome-associated translation inhibitor RaiA [candidate division CSSED10-310 bacterium]